MVPFSDFMEKARNWNWGTLTPLPLEVVEMTREP